MPNPHKLTTVQTKAIAEALDGHRTGETVHMVVDIESTKRCDARPVPEMTLDPDRVANSLTQRRKKQYRNVGQFQTERDPTLDGTGAGKHYAVIVHEPNTHSFALKGGFYGGFRHIKDIRVQFELTNGALTEPVSLRPSDTNAEDESMRTLPWADAVFFSFAAVDKLVMPYYTRLYGVEEAARMRAKLAGETAEATQEFLAANPGLR